MAARATRPAIVAAVLALCLALPAAAVAAPPATSGSEAQTPTVAAATKAAAVTLSAKLTNARIAYGTTAVVSGTLHKKSGTALPGRTVSLERKAPAVATWTKVASAKTGGGGGAYSFTRTAQRAIWQYRVRFAGATGLAAGTSHGVTLVVVAPLTQSVLSPASTAAVVGDPRTWTATTAAALAGVRATVQRASGTTWVTAASALVGRSGAISVRFVTTPAGTQRYRLVVTGLSGVLAGTTSTTRTLTVKALSVTTSSLPGAVAGTGYSTNLLAANAAAPVTWTWSGAKPPGLALSAAGTLAGTPTSAGAWTPTFRATDAHGQVATRALRIEVAAAPLVLHVLDGTLPAAQVGVGYAFALRAADGSGPLTWSLGSGALPAGLTLNAHGVLLGRPTATGSSSFTVQVSDAGGATATRTVTLAVGPAANWAARGADAGLSGSNVLESTITAGNVARVAPEWSLAPSGANALVDGVLYSTGSIGSPSTSGLLAYDVSSGELLWSTPIPAGFGSSYSCGQIVVTATAVVCNTTISIVAVERGGSHAVLWDTRLTDPGVAPFDVVVAGDAVIATTGTGNDAQVTSYRLSDGARAWQRPIGTGRPDAIASDGTRVFVIDSAHAVRAFSATGTGTPQWTKATSASQVVVSGGALLVVEHPGLVRRDPATGAVVWSYTTPVNVFGQMVADETQAYLSTAEFDELGGWSGAGATAVRLADGTAAWSAETDYPVRAGMAVQHGILWVHASELARERQPSSLFAVDTQTGAVLRTITMSDTSAVPPIVGNGHVLAQGKALEVLGVGPRAPRIDLQRLPIGWTGSPYAGTLTAGDGVAPYAWSVTDGTLPAGIALAPNGSLGGTPTAAGTSRFTVTLTDANGRSTDRLVTLAVRAASTQAWPLLGGDTGRTGVAAGQQGIDADAVAAFGTRWTSTADDTTPSSRAAEIVASGSRAFVIGGDGVLRAYDTTTASAAPPLWQRAPAADSGSFLGSPTLTGTPTGGALVAVTSGGHVVRVAAATGGVTWDTPIPDVSLDGDGSALVVGSLAIVQAGRKLVALNVTTGTISWTHPLTDAGTSRLLDVSSDGTRVFAFDFCHVVAVSVTTGAQEWSQRYDPPESTCADPIGFSGTHATPVYRDGVVYAGTLSGMGALRASTGELLWTVRDPLDIGPTVTEQWVLSGTSYDGTLTILDRFTGERVWQSDDDLSLGSAPVVAGDLLFARTSTRLVAIDLTTLETVWQSPTLGASWTASRPSIAGGRLYVTISDGTIRAIGAPG